MNIPVWLFTLLCVLAIPSILVLSVIALAIIIVVPFILYVIIEEVIENSRLYKWLTESE